LYLQSDFYKERPDLLDKLKQLLEVDLGEAEELAEARVNELYELGGVNMGTKAYAALLSIARGGLYGHVAMLLMGEGALADLVLSAPATAYERAKDIARGRGEAVDPSYSGRRGRSVGQPSWEDRAASALLRYLLGRADEDLKFRRVREGFDVFRTYGGVESYVDTLKIGKSVRSKAAEEELRRFVEEAKKHKPDLSGMDKAPQYLEWLNTDVSFDKGWIVAATADTRQAAWYVGLFGEPESSRGGASVTEEGVKPNVTMYWSREKEDQILRESRWLESLLGRRVESWRELVGAIDWRWVLKKVEELADELKPWIGPERMRDEEREDLMRRMLGELALLVHFAEARRGMDDSRWREERARRLAKAVETLSRRRIAGEYADRLAQAIIYYAEGRKKYAEKRIDELAKELVGAPKEDVKRIKGEDWGVVERVLSGEDLYAYCLARDCADDRIIRKFVAPALELIMLEKALRGEFDREEALIIFGEMYATAVAGDGTVGSKRVELAVGGELGGGAALLRLAALHMLNGLLPKELKFNARAYMGKSVYNITATGENAAGLMRLLAVSAPSAGGEYLSDKFNEFVKAASVEVQLDKDSIRLTDKGRVAADLTISEGGAAVKYTVYLLKDVILLHFASSDRSRVELAARLLRLAGVSAEVKKVGDRDEWRVEVTTDKLAAGRKELRDAVRKVVEEALEKGWVDEKKARRWLEKLEEGLTLREGWPKYHVGVARSGSLVVRYETTDPDNIVREVQRLKKMGLKEGDHFTVKTPKEDRDGYVYIRREGLAYAARLSVYGEGEHRKLAAEFVEYILQRAWKAGKEVYEKVREIVEEGKTRGTLTLKDFEKEVEVNGKKHVVKVINGGAEFKRGRDGRKLLRIRITAEVDGVRSEYAITFGRYGEDNAAMGFAYASVDAPGGREADAERFSALVEALTGKRPRVYRMNNGRIKMECYKEHLDGFARYAELADAIEKWLEETGR
ncbi:MAG: PaRep2b protein, partial [Pyrobaculum sp.]